ncbi:MAG: rod shape-determining protein RodA [Candidatus Rokubacteria bacterium]|nr:rod shape-determining protein RodA [Candidatus Rokubacteria bacterium]
MIQVDRRLLLNLDWALLAFSLAVVSIGWVTLVTVSAYGFRGGLPLRQLLWIALGLVVLVILASIDYRVWVTYAPLLYGIGIFLLGMVLVWGRSAQGARRWLAVGGVGFQPTELFKVIFILILAAALGGRRWATWSWGSLMVPLGLLLLPVVLILKQPDLGTAIILLPVAAGMLFAAGTRGRNLGLLALGGVVASPLLWIFLKDYQRERLLVYLDPGRDPLGTAWNVAQSKIAIGSGMVWGKGLFGGTQSRLAFLPERHTDFVFSVFAEEWGFVGCLLLLAGYFVIVMRGFEIAEKARDDLGHLLAVGATTLLAAQVCVNIGMATGFLPVVGLPLPFMSYGGSAMLSSLMTIGLLLNVRMRRFMFP